MRAMILGDTHANIYATVDAILACESLDVHNIFQLGDFGYWEHAYLGKRFLNEVNNELKTRDIKLYFIDGNHENHSMLRGYPDLGGYSEIRSEIVYLHRGSIHKFGDKTVACLGGAYSVDRDWRVENESWWPEEVITQEEVDRFKGQKADILFSHDAPSCVDLNAQLIMRGRSPYFYLKECEEQRALVNQAVNILDVSEVYHGHHHLRYDDIPYNGLRVTGLACDGHGKDSWILRDF